MGLLFVQLLSAASLVVRFRRSRGVERQQLLWVVFGAGVMLAGVLVQVILVATGLGQGNDTAGAIAGVFFAAIPLTTGIAICSTACTTSAVW